MLDYRALLYYISIAMVELEGPPQIIIDAKSAVPVYEQIKRAIKLDYPAAIKLKES